jgi:cytochrome P450 family 150 subfamily A5
MLSGDVGDGSKSGADQDELDFFTDRSFIADPYPYFDRLREDCPIQRESHHDVVMVTGYEEAVALFSDSAAFSSCNAMSGPFPGFPFPFEGDDVSELVEAYRDRLPMSHEITTMDPPEHSEYRAIVARYLTPKHVNAIEPTIRRTADALIDKLVDRGECEIITDFSGPFSLLTICAVLGVPESDHQTFVREMLDPDRGLLTGSPSSGMAEDPFAFLHERFGAYIADRMAQPRDDVMTKLLRTPFPNGSMPALMDAVRLASILFIAGIGATAGLLATAFQVLGEDPDLQQLLRDDSTQIPNFIEETLRIDSELKGTFRFCRTTRTVGDVEIPAGSTVMLLIGAANRDPRKFEHPGAFRIDRPNSRQHLAFGRGAHLCLGAPLARVESRIGVESMLARFGAVRISESAHGPAGARTYRYVPTYLSRSLRRLHLELTPSSRTDQLDTVLPPGRPPFFKQS